jgi:hypothetical protein
MNDPSHQPTASSEHHENSHAEHGLPKPPAPLPGTKGKRRAADRLNIPSSIVHNSGFAPGDKVFVVDEDPAGGVAKPCLVLLKEQPPKFVSDYTVAKGCRIRVTPAVLKKCGLDGENFDIDGRNGKIVISLRKEATP